jgi:hypothetical protein
MSKNEDEEEVRPLYPGGVEEDDDEKKKYPDDEIWPKEREYKDNEGGNIDPLYPLGVDPK